MIHSVYDRNYSELFNFITKEIGYVNHPEDFLRMNEMIKNIQNDEQFLKLKGRRKILYID